MAAASVSKLIKENNVEYVDLRFADMRGLQHHVTFPARTVDETFFEEGKMFDGSSIAGWKGINDSDMVLMPDAESAVLDPFAAVPTVIMTCDVLEPSTMQAYTRCPRSVGKRAEAYLKSSGVADTAYFGPEPEFFIFDSVRWRNEMQGASFEIDSEEAAWSSNRKFEDATPVTGRGSRAATFRWRRSIRWATCAARSARCSSRWAWKSKCTITRWRRRGSARSGRSSAR